MKRLGILIVLVYVHLFTIPTFALGSRRPPPAQPPAPTPLPTPTPPIEPPAENPAPCSSAGPLIEHDADEYVVSFKAANDKYIAAECGGDDLGLMNANRDSAAEWELFYVKPLGDGMVSIRSSHGRYLSANQGGGHELRASKKTVGDWEKFFLKGQLRNGSVVGIRAPNGVHWMTAFLNEDPARVSAEGPAYGPWEQLTLKVTYSPQPTVHVRQGVVRAEGRSFVDDEGPFYPLGATLMWALRGWKFDRDRVKQNLDFLGRHGYDYVRILGEVGWSGNDINPNWPDYEQNLAEFMDYAYDVNGLRVELTAIGGGYEAQADILFQKIINVVRGRENKVLNFEVANESYSKKISLDEMRKYGRMLRQAFPRNLVALSSAEGTTNYKNSGDFRNDFADVYMRSDSANLATVHMERTFGDQGWREVRQSWDWKDYPYPISHNEPIGPRSSVAEEMDPVRLAMLRAVGLINGVEAFVLHNASGVMGQVDNARNRPANLWEVPNIDSIMEAVRGVDKFLPQRVGDGRHWNNAWIGNPFVADTIWEEGGESGVNRNYTVSTPDGWVSTQSGVHDHCFYTVSRHSLVEVYDVLQGKVQEVELQAGQKLLLNPVSRDSFGNGAFIIVGHYR